MAYNVKTENYVLPTFEKEVKILKIKLPIALYVSLVKEVQRKWSTKVGKSTS